MGLEDSRERTMMGMRTWMARRFGTVGLKDPFVDLKQRVSHLS